MKRGNNKVNSRSGHLFLILVGILLTLKLQSFNYGHDTQQKGVMAFFNGGSQPLVVLKGDVMHPGVYVLSDVSSLGSVIKMAVPSLPCQNWICPKNSCNSFDGKKICLYSGHGNTVEIVEENVGMRERILLGLPLQLDQLVEDDWVKLPGIGPVMAKRIVLDRQNNGDFGRFYQLQRVEGIGNATIERLAPYFLQRH